ncbi:MFS transporter [Fimbriimonas ginsengisoli]|uniref:MFS permease n=1 Tax=Fimbriimonas ginsengisoli Gsoil 348 TaxID=661478 RepID=A0A068NN31_FIMGI|nr:MFS transporter [Fimbriimonas ginsengisoli]AIE84871.1 MFS permease [Fimbriimonas ginsengisoli Gsoil 348]
MSPTPETRDPYAALRFRDVRMLIASAALSGLAGRGLAVVIGFQVYAITKDPLALGFLGLVEAIPALSLVLYGGHVADNRDRRMLVLLTGTVSVLCALAFAALSWWIAKPPVLALYGIVFVAGIARGFANPAGSAFEAQVVPREVYVNASAWSSSVWQMSAIAGPMMAGFAFAGLGPARTYLIIAGLQILSWGCVYQVAKRPIPESQPHESVWLSIREGIHFVVHNQSLVGSMALDLFAVFFGGAIALLPIFATDILKVGPQGFGFLNAAPSVGALLVMLWTTRHPPVKRAGVNLLLSVGAFGISMIVFGVSKNFYLSLLALAASGGFDGVNMVIRGVILRMLTPEHLRGRVAAVSWVFIGSSNELGAMESGIFARLMGTARSVWAGGVLTLLVVAATAKLAPELRRLSFEPKEV